MDTSVVDEPIMIRNLSQGEGVMPFEPEKDKIIKKWVSEKTGLQVSINRYDEGEAKVQIGPRIFKRKDGSEVQRKAGRLTIEDIGWLYDIFEALKNELEDLVGPR
jgi:hypothetical protein